ncbi:MAG: class I SAM-dependent methyltransferase [Desulfovibrio sp.]
MNRQPTNPDGTVALTSLDELSQERNWLLYPAASGASYFRSFLKERHPDLAGRAFALSDRDPNKWGLRQEGLDVIPPDRIAASGADRIIVCASGGFDAIHDELRDRLGPDLPIVLHDNIREYIDWEAEKSALARLVRERNLTAPDISGHGKFFQSLPFAPGAYPVSSKGALTYRHLEHLALPERLDGKTVLDLGASDCFYGMEALARGAASLSCLESFYWREEGGMAKNELVRRHFGMEYERLDLDANEITHGDVGSYDLVFCLGLFYHLRDPFRLLRNLREITRERLFISGRTVVLDAPDPFHGTTQRASISMLSGRGFGKWTPNLRCLLDMLRIAGFRNTEVTFDFCPAGSMIATTAVQAW